MITTDDLLLIYRHSKALVLAVEKVLREQGVIKCPACGQPHKVGEPHTAKLAQPIVLTKKMTGGSCKPARFILTTEASDKRTTTMTDASCGPAHLTLTTNIILPTAPADRFS